MGARLGQGWLFGRPSASITSGPTGELRLPTVEAGMTIDLSPFSCLDLGTPLRRSTKELLIEVAKHLEREAIRQGPACVVAVTFQDARHFTPGTARRYGRLAEAVGFVCVLGEDLPAEPVARVRGAQLPPGDALRGEWDLVVLSPHFAAALLARDLGDEGPDRERRFDFAVTYRRDVVIRAANALLARVAPALVAATPAPVSPAPCPAL